MTSYADYGQYSFYCDVFWYTEHFRRKSKWDLNKLVWFYCPLKFTFFYSRIYQLVTVKIFLSKDLTALQFSFFFKSPQMFTHSIGRSCLIFFKSHIKCTTITFTYKISLLKIFNAEIRKEVRVLNVLDKLYLFCYYESEL